jgi:CRISPR/Cas system-associated protein Csx1
MAGSVRSTLIATWGKPSAWSLMNYRLGNKVERGYSMLPALLKPHPA